jgi:hypothetical protein
MTTTITLTGHDRHRILDDLWAVAGLGDHIDWMAVKSDDTDSCSVYLKTDAHVAPLSVAYGLLDDQRTWTYGQFVYLRGTYRGVSVVFSLDLTVQDVPDTGVAKAALADLNAAIGGEQS